MTSQYNKIYNKKNACLILANKIVACVFAVSGENFHTQFRHVQGSAMAIQQVFHT